MTRTDAKDIDAAGRSSGRRWFGIVAALCAIGFLSALGAWQLERLSWKEGVIRQIEERRHAGPLPLPDIERRFNETADVEYVPVKVTGRFLHAAERHFLSTFEGQSGWNIYTPLLLADGRAVFVNRGFVPYALKEAASRAEGEVEGEVTVDGLARNAYSSKPSSMIPDNDVGKNNYYWKSIAEMQRGPGLPQGLAILPFVIDAGPGSAPGGWPVGGTTLIDVPNNHLQYAFTWFGLAFVLAAMLVLFLIRPMLCRPPSSEPPTRPSP